MRPPARAHRARRHRPRRTAPRRVRHRRREQQHARLDRMGCASKAVPRRRDVRRTATRSVRGSHVVRRGTAPPIAERPGRLCFTMKTSAAAAASATPAYAITIGRRDGRSIPRRMSAADRAPPSSSSNRSRPTRHPATNRAALRRDRPTRTSRRSACGTANNSRGAPHDRVERCVVTEQQRVVEMRAHRPPSVATPSLSARSFAMPSSTGSVAIAA